MNSQFERLTAMAAALLVGGSAVLAAGSHAPLEPLPLELPKPLFQGTPKPIKVANLEAPRIGQRPEFLVPSGVSNLAAGKPVTSSDDWPIIGDLDYVTDGDKEGAEGYFVELGPDLQWVQIDLGESHPLYAIVVWHYHLEARVYHDVVIQVSNDPGFADGVTTLFNNDHDASAGIARGDDKAYLDSHEGRIIDAQGATARYVRLYSNGNTSNPMNHYIEVEVWGLPSP